MPTTSPAYAIAYLRHVDVNADIVTYIETIDGTLTPYGGQFLVHGGRLLGLEGAWDGDVVVIRFPDLDAATRWYGSPAYQAILALRTDNSESVACVVEGLPEGYRAVDKLAQLTGASSTGRDGQGS